MTPDPGPDEDVDDFLQIVLTKADVPAVRSLGDAERAVAANSATPAQAHGVHAAGRTRRSDDRLAAWRASQVPPAGPAATEPGEPVA